MDIVLEQAESIKIHAIRTETNHPSAVVTVGQGLPGRCHVDIVCGDRKHSVSINGDKMAVASGMSTGSEAMREQSLDCVEVEIRQAIETAKQQAVKQCYQIASSHEFGPDAAKTIRETFVLEI